MLAAMRRASSRVRSLAGLAQHIAAVSEKRHDLTRVGGAMARGDDLASPPRGVAFLRVLERNVMALIVEYRRRGFSASICHLVEDRTDGVGAFL
jgi:hypothetical protein